MLLAQLPMMMMLSYEFSDEIEDWVIEEFTKLVRYRKKYFKQDVDDLVRRTDLEEETIRCNENVLKRI
jgi:N utilization substance protein A